MDREDNSTILGGASTSNTAGGAGSVYGQDVKEMARRKKYGYRINSYSQHDQPWILTDEGRAGKRCVSAI